LSLALGSCADNDKSLGAACLKGEDCTSGMCSDQVCVAAPSTFDSEPPGNDGAAEAAAPGDATPADASRDAASDAALEAGIDAHEGGAEDTMPTGDEAKAGG
jgi:hypothetical protein